MPPPLILTGVKLIVIKFIWKDQMKRNMCDFNANVIKEQNDEDCNVIRL